MLDQDKIGPCSKVDLAENAEERCLIRGRIRQFVLLLLRVLDDLTVFVFSVAAKDKKQS